MNKYKYIVHLLVFFIILFVAYKTQPNPFELNSIDMYTEPAITVSSQDSLYKEIKKKSIEYEKPAQNAKIDKVWKKTPGRNGIKVNIEKSYEKMRDKGKFDESLLVFEQIEPEVTLKDLPASPIYRGHPEKNMVTLLINVAWGTENIPSILNTLKKNKVKANFFIEGKWASNNSDLVKMIQEEGHIIGNHAYNHPDMNTLSESENRKQVEDTNKILKTITGEKPIWFAPPSGSFNDEVVEIASQAGMETILWTVDTVDWKKPTTSVMVNRVMSNIHPGAMILMHPTDVIEQGLDELILKIKEKEYKIGTVERLLSEQR